MLSSFVALVMFFSTFSILSEASPLLPRKACPTVAKGYLAANVTNVHKAFTLNAHNKVNYIGDGKNKLAVEYHSCNSTTFPSPEFGYGGIIFVPSHQLCIGMSNQAAATGPYFTELQACDQSNDAQKFYTSDLKSYEWAGETDEEGTILQGGCGVLYYRAKDKKGTPFVTTASAVKYQMIEVVCSSDHSHVATATERSFLISPSAS